MKKYNNLQQKLRSIFFELISEISTHPYDELFIMLASRLNQLLHTTNTTFYLYNNWNHTFQLTTNQNHEVIKNKLLRDVDMDILETKNISNSTTPVEQLFHDLSERMKSSIIPLYSGYDPIGFILFPDEEQDIFLTNETSSLLKSELEQFVKVVNHYKSENDSEKKNKFLFDLTNRFYASINKNDILMETSEALKVLYPKFKFYILLSQDFKAESTLPIKEIEYSDDATRRVSTQAFMTGEVQLEDRVKEKKTYLYAPLKGNQGIYGVIQLITPQSVDFPKEEITFIVQFAKVAGKAIENATLYQHSKHLVSDLKLINEATHQLNSNLNILEITEIVRRQIMNACQATQVGFIYCREDSNYEYDILSGSTGYFYSDEGNAFSEYLLQQFNTTNESIFSGDFNDFHTFPYRSVMAIPMLHSGAIRGVITIMHEDAYFFSFENFKLMHSLIQHLTLALTNSILRDKLEQAAITDYLTKLYTRKYLNEEIEKHIETDEKGTLILFDIDDFKKINDTYGHHVGDEVIIQVANIITLYLGNDDIPARWGGEELAIYLPGASIDDGVQLASQIRKETERFTDPTITLSCGVSTWSSTSKESVKDVFIRADKALYEAKNVGKNCVVKGNNMQVFSIENNIQ